MLHSDVKVFDKTTLKQVEQILDAHTREPVPVTRWTRFSWSVSRHMTFERCKRAYYLHYYGARRVRDANNKVVSAVWWLKQMMSHPAWVGTVIHEIAASAVRDYREDRPLNRQALIRQATSLYRDGIRAAKRGARLGKRWVIIREIAYEEGFEPEEERIEALVHNLLNSEAFAFLATQSNILEVDEPFQSFDFVTDDDTIPVYAIPDVLLEEGGIYHIIDWKTGTPDPQTLINQAGVYYVYAQAAYGAESFKTHIADLNTGSSHHPAPDVKASREFIKASIATMKDHMQDEEYHTVSIHQFPMTDNLDECQTCAFKRVCWRHE